MRTIRSYTSSAEALGDVAVLESQSIAAVFKGAAQGDAIQIVAGGVELQVEDADYEAAERLLSLAEKDRAGRYVAPEKRKKTPPRYFRISLLIFFPLFALIALKAPFSDPGVADYLFIALIAGTVAGMIGLFCALLDL